MSNLLHVVNKSPFERDSLDLALSYALEGSGILMIEDGVYGAMQNTSVSSKVSDSTAKVYVLGPDLKARGISEDKLIESVKVIDYAGFVTATTEYDQVQSWL
jgi:tRNA 2-thiouridine synthesizing protein B